MCGIEISSGCDIEVGRRSRSYRRGAVERVGRGHDSVSVSGRMGELPEDDEAGRRVARRPS
jgi:hypothetical protein